MVSLSGHGFPYPSVQAFQEEEENLAMEEAASLGLSSTGAGWELLVREVSRGVHGAGEDRAGPRVLGQLLSQFL